MSANIYMGFLGWCRITPSGGGTGIVIKINGSTLNPVQSINAPQLVQGSYLKKAWNYSPVEVGGNITAPAGSKTFVNVDGGSGTLDLWDSAYERDSSTPDRMANIMDVEIQYVDKDADGQSNSRNREFKNCQVASVAFSVTAGDVANYTLELMGGDSDYGATTDFGVEAGDGSDILGTGDDVCERLVTFDQCDLTWPDSNLDEEVVESWDFTLNNNLERNYVVGQDHYYPVQITAGTRELNGSIGVFAPNVTLESKTGTAAAYYGADQWDDYAPDGVNGVQFTIAGKDLIAAPGADIIAARVEASSGTSAQIYNVNFEAICEY